jgi:hypothetical protein
MKKLMFVAAAAIASSAFCIESANTVGYTAKTIQAGMFYLVGAQFDETGTTSAGRVDMNKLIKLPDGLVAGEYDNDFATAPVIQVQKAAGGYDKYYYISDGTYDDGEDTPLGKDAWCDVDGYELTDAAKLTLGKGVWFKSPVTGGSLTFSGQVSDSSSTALSFTANMFHIFCNPYPCDVALKNVTTTAAAGEYDNDFATAPVIQVQKAAGGYDKYYYISDGTYDDGEDTPLGKDEWCDVDGYELEGNQIEAGAAFWFKAPVNGTLTFTK